MFRYVEQSYGHLLETWGMSDGDKNFEYKKKITSCLRRIVPLGVATGGVWTGNMRALRHVIALRTDPAAEEEITHVFGRIAKMMINQEQMLFGDFDDNFVPKYKKV